jgi:geranylgeranyl diphosphate synthase, type II
MKNSQLKQVFEDYLVAESKIFFSDKTSNESEINQAILYSLLAPGKRLRPLLCLGFARGFMASERFALACGLGVEMIHTYSLIHDDLPAMDNDDFRRGRPTNHKVFGEALAILAGDALLNGAPLFLLSKLRDQNFPSDLAIELTCKLLSSSGHEGMILGQAMDMKYEGGNSLGQGPDQLKDILTRIHTLKTARLMQWSCEAGLMATGDVELIKAHGEVVKNIGRMIGVLFQIVDDVLDVSASLNEIGKTPGKDLQRGKLTYTSLYGLEKGCQLGWDLVEEIKQELNSLPKQDWGIILEIIEDLKLKLQPA